MKQTKIKTQAKVCNLDGVTVNKYSLIILKDGIITTAHNDKKQWFERCINLNLICKNT